jgi:hypothetical protein
MYNITINNKEYPVISINGIQKVDNYFLFTNIYNIFLLFMITNTVITMTIIKNKNKKENQ